jgi:hypothetical protein
MNFGFLGGIHGGQRELSHHAHNAERLEQYQRVNEYHITLLARLLAKMDATVAGERTLLDNSMVLFCSSLMDGNAHDGSPRRLRRARQRGRSAAPHGSQPPRGRPSLRAPSDR